MYQTSSLNVHGRSSAEEAAAAAALTRQVGENILSEEGEKTDIKENLHPKSNTSKLSTTSSTSVGKRNGDDDNGLTVFEDDDDTSIDIEGRKSETSYANQSIGLSLSASNYSFSAAVAPISLDNQSTKRVNTSNSQQDFTILQSRYVV